MKNLLKLEFDYFLGIKITIITIIERAHNDFPFFCCCFDQHHVPPLDNKSVYITNRYINIMPIITFNYYNYYTINFYMLCVDYRHLFIE